MVVNENGHLPPACVSSVFVRYNLGPGVAVELQQEASVAQLKEVVGSQQGVQPEHLRVLFAGRELSSSATLQVRSGEGETVCVWRRLHLLLQTPTSHIIISACSVLLLLLSGL